MLCQFTKEVESHVTLADYLDLPNDVYPVGRLDKDSEGLLLLTNDNQLKTRLLNPKSKSEKTYWAQVDGDITPQAINKLRKGVDIKHNKKVHHTLPAKVNKINNPKVEERTPPVRFRANIPTSWVELTIVEGKNRQVRKMCAAVGFPVLRLIRVGINTFKINKLAQGEVKEIKKSELI